jgi:hypothetical protein
MSTRQPIKEEKPTNWIARWGTGLTFGPFFAVSLLRWPLVFQITAIVIGTVGLFEFDDFSSCLFPNALEQKLVLRVIFISLGVLLFIVAVVMRDLLFLTSILYVSFVCLIATHVTLAYISKACYFCFVLIIIAPLSSPANDATTHGLSPFCQSVRWPHLGRNGIFYAYPPQSDLSSLDVRCSSSLPPHALHQFIHSFNRHLDDDFLRHLCNAYWPVCW